MLTGARMMQAARSVRCSLKAVGIGAGSATAPELLDSGGAGGTAPRQDVEQDHDPVHGAPGPTAYHLGLTRQRSNWPNKARTPASPDSRVTTRQTTRPLASK